MKPYQLVYTNSGTTGLRISLASAVTLCLILAIVLIGNDILPGQSGAYIRHVSTPVTSIFEGIYSNRGWGEYGNGSGEGSTLESTRRTRLIVELLVTRYGVNSLLDAPCGAMAWMPYVVERLQRFNPSFKYCGVDVVPTVINSNAARFKRMKNFEFQVVDIAQHPLPIGYEMVWSRDALQHLSYDLIVPALENFAYSSTKYVVIGSYKTGSNRNISNGEYFDIDVRKIPFGLTTPVDVIDEETFDGKELLVYETSYLRQQDFTAMRKRTGLLS